MKKPKTFFTMAELVLAASATLLSSSICCAFISKAHRDAQAAQCAENLFAMGKATFQYAADHKDDLPFAGDGHDSWKLQIAPYLGIKNPAEKGEAGKFKVFHCPLDQNQPPRYMSEDPFYLAKNSYCANLYAIDVKNHDKNTDGSITTRKLKSIDGPDTVLLYAENHDRTNMVGAGLSVNWNRAGEYAYPVAAKKGYHQGKNNYLLLDGGVEFWTFRDTVYPEDLWFLKYGSTDL